MVGRTETLFHGSLPSGRFDVVVEDAAGVVMVRASGDIDLETERMFLEHVAKAIAVAHDVVVVDLSACSFISSRAVGALEMAAILLERWTLLLVVRHPPASFRVIDGHRGAPWTFVVDQDGGLGLAPIFHGPA